MTFDSPDPYWDVRKRREGVRRTLRSIAIPADEAIAAVTIGMALAWLFT